MQVPRLLRHTVSLGITVLTVLVMVFTGSRAVTADMLTGSDLNSVVQGTPFYDPSCSSSSSPTTVTNTTPGTAATTTLWNSGLQPPYILEQFAIQLLKDIATKKNVPATNTVTQDHVVALVTFAYGEGGGITNNDFWNPFNTGYNAPDLLATAHDVSGVQAFKSFDAGVEANARVMTGTNGSPYETRVGDVLANPASTVNDFFQVLTYYNNYPGNLAWATKSMQNPAQYKAEYMNLANQTVSQWNKMAALVMRGSVSDPTNVYDASKLTLHPQLVTSGSAVAATGSAADGCVTSLASYSGDAAGIAAQAKHLAWPQTGHGPYKDNATGDYIAAEEKFDGFTTDATLPFSDCGVFVATVMRSSGADPNYPRRGTPGQLTYLENHQTFQRVRTPNGQDPTNTSLLRPGDIMITTSGLGHTYIYVGPWGTGPNGQQNYYNAAAASWLGHVPQPDNFYQDVGGQHFAVFRFVGNKPTVNL